MRQPDVALTKALSIRASKLISDWVCKVMYMLICSIGYISWRGQLLMCFDTPFSRYPYCSRRAGCVLAFLTTLQNDRVLKCSNVWTYSKASFQLPTFTTIQHAPSTPSVMKSCWSINYLKIAQEIRETFLQYYHETGRANLPLTLANEYPNKSNWTSGLSIYMTNVGMYS